jgi:N-methylhydantoinase B
MKALAEVAPSQVSAGIGNLRVIAFSGLRNSEHWVHMEIFEGSYGGRDGKDGMDAVDTLYANTRNNPIEDIESHLPLRVGRYELREDVCGAGQWRGGLGSIREFEYLDDGGAAGLRLDRANGNDKEGGELPSKVPHTAVQAGDKFVCVGPAGGGYGDPMLREAQQVLEDVTDGLISIDTAARDYGVVITPDLNLDEAATAQRRAS